MPEDWKVLLRETVERTSRAEVARMLGVSRSAVSLLCNGKYPGGEQKMAARVREVLGGGVCPRTGERVSFQGCAARRREAMPTSNPYALQCWRACQQCAVNR